MYYTEYTEYTHSQYTMGQQVDAEKKKFKKVVQNVRSKLKNIRTYFLSMKKYSKPPVIYHKMSNLWLKLGVLSVLVLR